MDLVVHEVLQALVEGGAHEDARLHASSGVSVVEDLVASLLVALVVQLVGDVLHRHVAERRAVALARLQRRDLAEQTLDELSDGHTRRNGVRVHDDVGDDAVLGEGHVFLPIRHSDRSLLPVSRAQLVSDLRDSHRAHFHLHEAEALLVGGQHHLVHDAALRVAQPRAVVLQIGASVHVQLPGGRGLADQDAVSRHSRALE